MPTSPPDPSSRPDRSALPDSSASVKASAPNSGAPHHSAARNIYAFGWTSLFNDTATEMAYWILPAFVASIGAGPAKLGIIEGVAESVASFAQLFSGYLADRLARRKPIVVGGYLVANAVKPLLALVSSWTQISGDTICGPLFEGRARDGARCDGGRFGGEGDDRVGIWLDSGNGFGGSDCRSAAGAGVDWTFWSARSVCMGGGAGGAVCFSGVARNTRDSIPLVGRLSVSGHR